MFAPLYGLTRADVGAQLTQLYFRRTLLTAAMQFVNPAITLDPGRYTLLKNICIRAIPDVGSINHDIRVTFIPAGAGDFCEIGGKTWTPVMPVSFRTTWTWTGELILPPLGIIQAFVGFDTGAPNIKTVELSVAGVTLPRGTISYP